MPYSTPLTDFVPSDINASSCSLPITVWQTPSTTPTPTPTPTETPTPTPIPHNQPATTTTLAPNADSQSEYPNPTYITLQATTDTGYSVSYTYYTIDNGSQQTYSAPFTVSGASMSHTITYWSVDNTGLEETPHKSQTFTISSTAIDTPVPAGQNQTVTIGNATLTFSDVTTAGYVVQTTSSNNAGGALPSEYKLLGTYYDLTTTASYSGSITVTMSYDPADVKNQNNLKLWHFDGTTWHDITTAVDTVNHTITGTTSSLSPFAIGEKDITPPTLTNFQLSPYVIANGSSSTISVSAQDDIGVSSGAKTNLGFNVKYLSNNSANPDGSFVMNDKQDGLEVKSTSLDWPTVSGSTGDFLGQATVNGSGSYAFRAHIVDGSPDQFDIRVWGSNNSFDNPTYRIASSLGGGSIVIHQ